MFGSGINAYQQQNQLDYQKELNNYERGLYNSRNKAVRDALMSAVLGGADFGSYANNYLKGGFSSNVSYSDFLKANPQLASSFGFNEDTFNNIKSKIGLSNTFDANDFITLYNMGQNEITRHREDTAIQRAVKDWEKAGMNPLLFGGSGAQSSSYQTSGSSNVAPKNQVAGSWNPINFGLTFGSITDAMLKYNQSKVADAQAEQVNAQTDLIKKQAEKIDSDILLNGSLVNLNADQSRVYRQQVHQMASELPLNNIRKEILLGELSVLQYNLKLAQQYGLSANQQIPVALAGINHILDNVADVNSSSYISTGLFAAATMIPMFKLGSASFKAITTFAKKKFGYKRVDNLLKKLYDKKNKGVFK